VFAGRIGRRLETGGIDWRCFHFNKFRSGMDNKLPAQWNLEFTCFLGRWNQVGRGRIGNRSFNQFRVQLDVN